MPFWIGDKYVTEADIMDVLGLPPKGRFESVKVVVEKTSEPVVTPASGIATIPVIPAHGGYTGAHGGPSEVRKNPIVVENYKGGRP